MARIINKEEKRNAIALSCINLFCQKGIQKTSIEEIAKNACVAKGTIYLYFKNKDEIIFAIWDILTQQHEESVNARIKPQMSSKEKILNYFNFIDFEKIYDKEKLLVFYQNFVSSMLIDETKLYTSYFESFFQRDYEYVFKYLQEGVIKGEFQIDDIDMLSNTIIMILKGSLIKAKASNLEFLETQNILNKHLDYLINQYTNK